MRFFFHFSVPRSVSRVLPYVLQYRETQAKLRGRKRKMRVLSLMHEQRGYYHATGSLIYSVCYVTRILLYAHEITKRTNHELFFSLINLHRCACDCLVLLGRIIARCSIKRRAAPRSLFPLLRRLIFLFPSNSVQCIGTAIFALD